MNLLEIKKRLEFHEGFRSKSYLCTRGKKTIGIGRNLDDNPLTEIEKLSIKDVNNITKAEAYFLLENDITKVISKLNNRFPFFTKLDDERKYALIDMCFQMGLGGLLGFKEMIKALSTNDYVKASKECLDSDYARKDTPARANRIARLIKTGVWRL